MGPLLMMRGRIYSENPRTDGRVLTDLADRVFVANVDWLDGQDSLDPFRVWEQQDLHRTTQEARERRLPLRGDFKGRRPEQYELFRAALLLAADHDDDRAGLETALVILGGDLDGHIERRHGMETAITSGHWPFEVVSAWAAPEIEAWKVAASDRKFADAARLTPNPVDRAHELTNGGRRDVKQAWDTMRAEGAPDDVLATADLAHLQRGEAEGCGLAPYVRALSVLAPQLFNGRAPP